MDSWYLDNLTCPHDGGGVEFLDGRLVCRGGHRFPVVDGIPVMLRADVSQTMGLVTASIRDADRWREDTSNECPLFLNSLGINDEEKKGIVRLAAEPTCKVDPVVSYLVGATSGIAYKHLIGRLQEYPIPTIRLPHANGETLLDVGCNWGRWSIAAAAKGYKTVGIDPSLGAVMAAKRVTTQLGLDTKFVVGDARFLPFRSTTFDRVFSYSVLQHLNRDDVVQAVAEIGRVLKVGGHSMVQMPTVLGIRCLYHQARRRFRKAQDFEVRYWTVPALRRLFASGVGITTISVDCFFGTGLQYSDMSLMPLTHKVAIVLSELLSAASRKLYPLTYIDDSVYASSMKITTHTKSLPS